MMQTDTPILETITENFQATSLAMKINTLGLKMLENNDQNNNTLNNSLIKRSLDQKLSTFTCLNQDENASNKVLNLFARFHITQK